VRILHALHFFLPQHSGGTEVYTLRLARAQSKKHDVALFFSEKIHSRRNYELLRRTTEGLDCRVVVNNLLYPNFRATFDNAAIELRFEEVLADFKPDVVHVQHLMLLSMGLVEAAKRSGARVVVTLQDFWLWCARMGQLLMPDGSICSGPRPAKCAECLADFPYTQKRGAAHAFRGIELMRRTFGVDLSPLVERVRGWQPLLPARRASDRRESRPRSPLPEAQLAQRAAKAAEVLELVDRIVAPSQLLRDRAVEWGAPADRISLLRYGVDLPPRRSVRRYAPDGRVRFAFIGTPAPHKGVHVLIDGFRAAGLENASLTIFGSSRTDPVYFADLKRRAQGLSVTFPGAIPNAQVPSALEEIDALVVPSLWLENWPVVVQEARLMRVPVIASRIGGLAEGVRHGVDGLLFEPGDAVGLATALRRVAREPKLLARFAAKATLPPPMEEHEAALEKLYAMGGARPASGGGSS
jgi:glycosyltransferase involved in cell wall biosynthesis